MGDPRRRTGRWTVLGLLGLGVALAVATQFLRVPGAMPRLRMFPADAELREPGSIRVPARGFTHLLVGRGRGKAVPPERLVLRPAAVDASGTVVLGDLEPGPWTVALVALGPDGPVPGPPVAVSVLPGAEAVSAAALPAGAGRLALSRTGAGALALRPWPHEPVLLELGRGNGPAVLPLAPGRHAPVPFVDGRPVPLDPFDLEPGGEVLRSLP